MYKRQRAALLKSLALGLLLLAALTALLGYVIPKLIIPLLSASPWANVPARLADDSLPPPIGMEILLVGGAPALPWGAFVASLSSRTNVSSPARQYALFSSLILLLPKFTAGFAGEVEALVERHTRPGTTVVALSMHRDEAIFGDPDEVRLDRDPEQNLLYRRGIHVCPGAFLSRLALPAVMEALLNAPGDLALVPGPRTPPQRRASCYRSPCSVRRRSGLGAGCRGLR